MHRVPPLIFLLLAAAGAPALAATFVVTKETDDNGPCVVGDCALREAVIAANDSPGADTIVVPPGVYQLSLVGPVPENASLTGDLDSLDSVTIVGEPTQPPVIRGDGTDRVLDFLGSHDVIVSNLVVEGGVVAGDGGGVSVTSGSFLLENSIIRDNTAIDGSGGGIVLAARSSRLVGSAIVDNRAPDRRGGGVQVTTLSVFDDVELVNVTISDNHAEIGGGIFFFGSGSITVRNVTVANNTANQPFSAALVGDLANNLTFLNSLIVKNDCGYIAAIPMSNGHNMEGPTATCFVPGDGDAMGVPDVMIGPLADNGGPTPTHALLPGSPAIDAAAQADCPATDQRGAGGRQTAMRTAPLSATSAPSRLGAPRCSRSPV